MLLIIIGTVLALTGLIGGVVYSKCKFEGRLGAFAQTRIPKVKAQALKSQIDQLAKLKANILQIKRNIQYVDIPTPEALSYCDDTQSSLDKISKFFEKHNVTIAGGEQFILTILPTSQIGQSLHAMCEAVPHDLGNALFGDALSSLKDGVATAATHEGLSRFLHGMTHLSHQQIHAMQMSCLHHDVGGVIMKPIKNGVMELFNVNQAGHDVVSSIKDVSADLSSSLEHCSSFEHLTSATDIDFGGHIPVVTIAFSSFREYQLLASDKTDFISSAKNISLDAAGAGIGGAAGAKAGAIIGSLFGPLGTVIGGIVGGVAGGIGGKSVSNKVKRIPLDNAIENYETSYNIMISETKQKSRDTLQDITQYCNQKKTEFKQSETCVNPPVADCDVSLQAVCLAIYHHVLNEMGLLKKSIDGLKNSIWYSSSKYESIVNELESRLRQMQNSLPSLEMVKTNPKYVIDTMVKLEMPTRILSESVQAKINECSKELKGINDRNNASVLMWSYVVNQLYQKTLNDIASYSNQKMSGLNTFFADWRETMVGLEQKINKEKGKLGL